MKPVEFPSDLLELGDGSSSMLRLVSDFGRDISASLELDDVLHAILLNTSQLISSDILEVKLWDGETQALVPYTLDMSGRSAVQNAPHSQFGNMTDYLVTHRKPILVVDTRTHPDYMTNLNGNSPVQSYLGLPLLADNQLVGTLELGHLTPGILGQHDFELTQLVSSQTRTAYAMRCVIGSNKNVLPNLAALPSLLRQSAYRMITAI